MKIQDKHGKSTRHFKQSLPDTIGTHLNFIVYQRLQTRRLIAPKNLARSFLTALEDFHDI